MQSPPHAHERNPAPTARRCRPCRTNQTHSVCTMQLATAAPGCCRIPYSWRFRRQFRRPRNMQSSCRRALHIPIQPLSGVGRDAPSSRIASLHIAGRRPSRHRPPVSGLARTRCRRLLRIRRPTRTHPSRRMSHRTRIRRRAWRSRPHVQDFQSRCDPFSVSGDPIVNLPEGMTTISGQSLAHSRKCASKPSVRSVSAVSTYGRKLASI